MIFLIYGQDTYRSREKLNEIIDYYKKNTKGDLGFKIIEAEGTKLEVLKSELKGKTIFKEKKLIILKDFLSAADGVKSGLLTVFKEGLEPGDIIVFYEASGISRKEPLFLFLEEKAKLQEFAPLQGQKLRSWVKNRFENYHCRVSESVILKLVELCGNDLWKINNEVLKLICYKKKSIIRDEDLELLVRSDIEASIFEAIDAIATRNNKKFLRLVHQRLEGGDSPLYILSMINFQFRNLLIIKDLIERGEPYYTFPKITGFHPFVIRKTTAQVTKFTLAELKKIYQKIFRVDVDIKRGRIEPQIGLDRLAAEI